MTNLKNVLMIMCMFALVLDGCNSSRAKGIEQYYGGPPAAYIIVNKYKQVAEINPTSWTYRTADGDMVHIDSTVLGISTPSMPLTVTVPFSASLVLPIDIIPASLGYAIYPVDESNMWSDDNGSVKFWNTPDWAITSADLPPITQQEIVFSDLSKGLHMMMVSAEWDDLGFVHYGFLFNIE